MNTAVAVPLPDGRWLVMEREQFDAAVRLGAELGLAPAGGAAAPSAGPERLLTSRELAAVIGVGDTTIESMAARGELPCHRFGKALRFAPSEVMAARRRKP